jgi:hypothetical protein
MLTIVLQAMRRLGFATVDSMGSLVRFDPPALTARPIAFFRVCLRYNDRFCLIRSFAFLSPNPRRTRFRTLT